MNLDSTDIKAEIRAEMARQRIGVKKLAALTGIPSSRLFRRFSSTPFNTDELFIVAEALGVTADELIIRAKRAA